MEQPVTGKKKHLSVFFLLLSKAYKETIFPRDSSS